MLGDLRPLRDPSTGEPYRQLPCMAAPHWWDYKAPAHLTRKAVRACRACPALAPCHKRAVELGDDAEGLWAGIDRGRRTSNPAERDPELLRWANELNLTLGVTITSPEPDTTP